jgi:hypothetical protein
VKCKRDHQRRQLLGHLREVFKESELSIADQIVILEIMKDELMNEYEVRHDLEDEESEDEE